MRTIFHNIGFHLFMLPRVLAIFSILVCMSSCSNAQIKSDLFATTLKTLISGSVDTIGVESLKGLVNESQGHDSSIILLDARTKKEYLVSHLPGAVWVGYEDFNLERLPKISQTQTVIVYCSVGYRSEKIGEKLKDKNIKAIKNLYGGIFEWSNRGYQMENAKGETTEKVHGYSKEWSIYLDSAAVILD